MYYQLFRVIYTQEQRLFMDFEPLNQTNYKSHLEDSNSTNL